MNELLIPNFPPVITLTPIYTSQKNLSPTTKPPTHCNKLQSVMANIKTEYCKL